MVGCLLLFSSTVWTQCEPTYQTKEEATVNGSSNLTINLPAGTSQDDLLIALLAESSGSDITAPAGWTEIIDDGNGADVRLGVFWKLATASEPANYTFTVASTDQTAGTILRYSGVDTANPINVFNHTVAGNIVSPDVTATSNNNIILRTAAIYNNTLLDGAPDYSAPASTTELTNHLATGGLGGVFQISIVAGEEVQLAPGPTGTATFGGTSTHPKNTVATVVIAGDPGCVTADYTMDTGGTVNTCGGIFADDGNLGGNYGDNATQTMTFCSPLNNHISFTFEHFNTQAGSDILNIYDGNSTGSPLIGAYSGFGVANSPGVVTSTETCLTFEFISDAATNSLGWEASISCTGSPPPNTGGGGTPWVGYPFAGNCGGADQIGGVIYEDSDNDGVRDQYEAPISGVTVTLFDDSGQVGTTTSNGTGNYTFSGLTAGTVYRAEFSIPTIFTEGSHGSDYSTAVQFIESGRCDADFNLLDVSNFCDNPDPYFVIPCFVNGDPQHSSNVGSTGVARYLYSDSGESPTASYTNYITAEAVGTTWGVAYDGKQDNVYLSTILKRHSGLGPGGIGAIYVHNDGDPNTTAPVFYDFGADAGVVESNAVRFPGSGTGFGQVGPCGPCDNIDPTTFGQIAKVGLGDIDMNPVTDMMYVTNLFDRKIYMIDLNNPTTATPLPGMPWLDNSICNNGVARPWALKYRRGKLYVGVICDASLSSCSIGSACSDLTANIYSFDGGAWNMELSFALDYYRDAYALGSNYFVKWIDDWSTMEPFVGNRTDANFAQPIVMDIEFADDFSMIIGIGDRTGYQLGYQAPPPPGPSSSTAERNMSFGDILKAHYDNTSGTFTLENNGVAGSYTSTNPTGNSGPGGKSFYWGDYWTGIGAKKWQGGIGALAVLPTSGEVMFPVADAVNYYSNGVIFMSNTTGQDSRRLEVYQGTSNGSSPNFAKSAGVGDIELLCGPPPLEIGNIVWWDDNGNGLQDPSEGGIPNVTMELWHDPNGSAQGNNPIDGSGIKVAETTTDAFGRYIFSYAGNPNSLTTEDWSFTAANAIDLNTFYQVRIPNWATDAGVIAYRNSLGYVTHSLSVTQNQGATGVERDNNAYDNPGNAAASVDTGDPGENDHNYDFAFRGEGGCEIPETIPTANTPCEGETLDLMATVAGGVMPYIFAWTGPNGFTSDLQNPSITSVDSTLNSGIYDLIVSDEVGCTDTVHIHVVINRVSIVPTVTDATCGGSDGAIDLTISGTEPYLIDWDTDGTGDNDDPEDLTGLAGGNYTVTVTDANGCVATSVIPVNNTGAATLAETHIDETCGLANGSIDLTITGGAAPYTIDWDNDGTGDNDDAEDLTGLTAGTYSVTVTDAAGCISGLSVTLTNSEPPVLAATFMDETCSNANGSADLTITGGTAPYIIDWDNDGTGDNDDMEDLTGLTAGTYNVTVTDNLGCTATTSVTISNTPPPTLAATTTDESCGNSNGSIDLTVTGGTPPFTYSWSNGLTTEDIIGVGEGMYDVTVTDSLGCMATTSVTLANIPGPTLEVTPTNATDCNTADGSIDLTVIGGTPPYSFDWDNDGIGENDDTEDLSGLASGPYNVLVTDANGCQFSIGTGIANANDPVIEMVITDPVNCGDTGDIDMTITSGTPPYTIDWDIDGLGDNDDTEDLTGVVGGVYTVIVTDADGCSSQGSASIKIIRPPAIDGTFTIPTCGGTDGSITLTLFDPDGSGPYTFDWDNDGTGDNDDPQDLTGIGAGNYTVTVSNSINCVATATFSLPSVDAPIVLPNVTNPTCNNADGSIDIEVMGGVAPYTFDWDNDGVGDNDDPEDLAALPAGIYQVIVTDANGCVGPASIELAPGPFPILNGVLTPVDCDGNPGSIDLMISGIEPFVIDWDNDGTGDNDDMEDLSNLLAGTYNVTVTDANGCSNNAAFTIIEDTLCSTFDLRLGKTVDTIVNCIGGNAVYTLTIYNEGTDDVTGIEVTDSLPAGLIYLSDDSGGSYNDTTGIWAVDTLAAGDSIVINISTMVNVDGVIVNQAEITAMDQVDLDSTPNNGIITEDDIADVCFSVPIEVCDNDSIAILLEAPVGYTNYQWYQNDSLLTGETAQSYTVTEAGTYVFTLDGIAPGDCLGELCCPVIVETINCCKPVQCIPLTVKKSNE